MTLRPLRIEPLDLEQVRKRRVLGQSDLLQYGTQGQELKSEDLPRIAGEGTEAEELEAKETPTFRVSTVGEPRRDFQQLLERINEAYKPETQDTERFRGLLDQFPQREEPSWRRKLVAGGLGLDARQRVGTQGQELTARGNPIPVMEAAMYAPHLRNLSDWKEKTQPFYNAANLERQSNIQERTLVSDALKAEQQERKNEIAEIRARAYAMKAAGYSFNFTGPYVMATRPDGTVFNTGWETGKMEEFDKENLRAQSRVEAATALGASRENIAERQQHPDTLVGGVLHTWDTRRQEYVEKMPGPEGASVTKVGTPQAGGRQPTDQQEQNATLQKLWTERPDLQSVIKAGATANANWFLNKPKGDNMAELRKYYEVRRILGLPDEPEQAPLQNPNTIKRGDIQLPSQSGSRGTPPPPTNVLQPRPPAQGQKPGHQLILPPGKSVPVWVPDSEVPNAIKNGGVRVRPR